MYYYEKKSSLMLWKTSNLWQSKIRGELSQYSLTINEFIILDTLFNIKDNEYDVTQIYLSKSSGINVSVISSVLKILDKKALIERIMDFDNRKKNIKLTSKANFLMKKIIPIINEIERKFFFNLGNENLNFNNSLRLIMGKKIRIKAYK